MSALSSKWMQERLIDENGQDVRIYINSFTVDDNGNITNQSYSETIETKAWVAPRFAGIHEEYLLPGYKIECDYTGSVRSTVDVHVNDRMILNDGTHLDIREIIIHYEYNEIAYKDLLMRKESSGT